MKSSWRLILASLALSICSLNPLYAQSAQPQVENLAFKILQKQAAEYEQSLSSLISGKLSKYIAEDRFHLSVRIYWNPAKVEELKTRKELKPKSGKLPGFPVFVREEEQGLDYYLGAGSVMKLKVEVLLDETLPARYVDFIQKMVPVQGRFVPERGDVVRVIQIPFPKSRLANKMPDGDIPLASDEATNSLLASINDGKKELAELEPVIVHPVLQRYLSNYEAHVAKKLKDLINQYVDPKKYLLTAKFYWNPKEVEKLKSLVVKSDIQGKVKLPGFTIYLEEKDDIFQTISDSAQLLRTEINVMIDESNSPDVDAFVKKMIPMTIKLIPSRGDKLIVYRGHFPKLGEDLATFLAKKSNASMENQAELAIEIDDSFRTGNYRKALLLVDLLLAKATTATERLPLLKKKGSLHLLVNERELARSAYLEVKRINPADSEVQSLLETMP